jgi:signal transduction histidine kinase
MTDEKPSILIVDDAPENIRVLGEALCSTYRVSICINGKQALEWLQKDPLPDLILLDIQMPDMDGLTVCQKLKLDRRTQSIPVIFITAMGEEIDETRGFEAGGVDYIVKPFRIPIVKSRIQTHLALKKQRDSLHQMTLRLQEMNQLKNRFLGMVAHDLRNPLSCMNGFVELMMDRDYHSLSEDDAEIMTLFKVSIQNMLSLVNDLLDVSVIESGRFDIRPSFNSLSTILNERLRIMRQLAIQKDIQIDNQMDYTPSTLLDRNRMHQVFDNLLSNAVKFSLPGTRITLSTFRDDDWVSFSIKDQGPGISVADQQKLFTDFNMLSNRPTHGERSSGLGLSIVKKIIDAHQGQILVESQMGIGTQITVCVPLRAESSQIPNLIDEPLKEVAYIQESRLWQ